MHSWVHGTMDKHRKTFISESAGLASSAAALRPSVPEAHGHRNAVFSREQARQRALYPRVEKIEVSLQGPGLQGTLMLMNKGMSSCPPRSAVPGGDRLAVCCGRGDR